MQNDTFMLRRRFGPNVKVFFLP